MPQVGPANGPSAGPRADRPPAATRPVTGSLPPGDSGDRRAAWLPVVAVVVTVLAWASAFVAIRWVGPHISAGPLALGRLLIGSVALGVTVLGRRQWVRPTRGEWGLVVVCGVGWFAVYNVALNAAEQRLDAGTTAMLINIGPLLIALGAGWLLGEGFPRWLLIGAGVALSGAVLIGISTGIATAGQRGADTVGVLLCLLAAVAYAVGVLAQKPVLRHLPALQLTFMACAIGAVGCLPYLPAMVRNLQTAPASAIGGVIYLGLVPTSIAFSTWAYALARMNAGRLGVTTYLVPPLTILGGALLLGEVPAVLALIGGAVCLCGVAISRRRG